MFSTIAIYTQRVTACGGLDTYLSNFDFSLYFRIQSHNIDLVGLILSQLYVSIYTSDQDSQ